jgi:site-specific DNA recombinase
VTFARVACVEQANEQANERIAAQLNLCRDYAVWHCLQVVREFTSVGKAGRKQFRAMLQFLKQNPDCRVIIAEKTDRLSRTLHDFVAVEELGAEVHLVKEGQIIASQPNSQDRSDRLVRGIFALMARHYIEALGEEIKTGQMAKAKRGQYPGRAPFGYVHNRASRTIEVDGKRGRLVTRIFKLCGSGTHSIDSLRKMMRDAKGGW